MSCACNKVHADVDPSKNGLQYSFIEPAVLFFDGKSIMTPLFPPARAPRGGWYFDLYLMGHITRINKPKPHLIAEEVARLLTLNEILYTPAQLWLNLNIQWVTRAIPKYQKVRLQDLLNISTPNF